MKIQVETVFATLPPEEREVIISHGTALRLSDLKKRHFLAASKVRYFEEKYHVTLPALESAGLPDKAGYEMHEDYILWRHWAAVANEIEKHLTSLEKIVQQGIFGERLLYAGI